MYMYVSAYACMYLCMYVCMCCTDARVYAGSDTTHASMVSTVMQAHVMPCHVMHVRTEISNV